MSTALEAFFGPVPGLSDEEIEHCALSTAASDGPVRADPKPVAPGSWGAFWALRSRWARR